MFGDLTDNFYNLVKGVVTLIQRSKVLVSVSMIDCYQRFMTLIKAQSRKLGERPKRALRERALRNSPPPIQIVFKGFINIL